MNARPKLLSRRARTLGALTALAALASCVDDGCNAGTYVPS